MLFFWPARPVLRQLVGLLAQALLDNVMVVELELQTGFHCLQNLGITGGLWSLFLPAWLEDIAVKFLSKAAWVEPFERAEAPH